MTVGEWGLGRACERDGTQFALFSTAGSGIGGPRQGNQKGFFMLRRSFITLALLASSAGLANLTALQTLDVWNTQVRDLAPLASLTALKTLNVSNTKVTDLSPLRSLIGLGCPSRPRRIQSYILKVKMYGVALISSTRLSAPALCTVPFGIRNRSCFFAG